MDYNRMKKLRKGTRLELKMTHDAQSQFDADIKISLESNPIIKTGLTSKGMAYKLAEFKVKILKISNPKSPISIYMFDDSIPPPPPGTSEYETYHTDKRLASNVTLIAFQEMQVSGIPREYVRLQNYDVDVKIPTISTLKDMALRTTLAHNPDAIYHHDNPGIVNLLVPK